MTVAERLQRVAWFLRRQPGDIREGGWPAAWWKALMLLDVILAIPFVLAARLLRPAVVIRFGGLPTEFIGHLALDMELLLCRRDAGWYGRTIDLFCCALPVCNQQLKRMWERTVHVSRFALAAERVNRWLPGGGAHRIPFDRLQGDRHGLLAQLPEHLSFTPEEKRQGYEALRGLGIPEGVPFVCVLARDPAYYLPNARRYRTVPMRNRDSDILTYVPAAEELIRRGYVAVRMGAAVERTLMTTNPRMIDYASIGRTDFLDVFLCAHCHFYLGDSAGLCHMPMIFRRRLAMANHIPFEYLMTWNPQDLFIPKTLWWRSKGRLMTFREMLESGISRYRGDDEFERAGVEVIDNTPKEIAALALEMEARFVGTWQATQEDEELQRRFWDLFRACTTVYASAPWRTHQRIGAEFLRQHQALLEPSTRSQPAVVSMSWASR